MYASLAQLVEQDSLKVEVLGSIPRRRKRKKLCRLDKAFFFVRSLTFGFGYAMSMYNGGEQNIITAYPLRGRCLVFKSLRSWWRSLFQKNAEVDSRSDDEETDEEFRRLRRVQHLEDGPLGAPEFRKKIARTVESHQGGGDPRLRRLRNVTSLEEGPLGSPESRAQLAKFAKDIGVDG